MNIQADYGGFDPLFPGVTIDVGSVQARKYFDPATRDENVGDIFKDRDPDIRFEALSVQSVASHEKRHFHDSLVIPYGARTFCHRLRQIIHSHQILPRFVEPGVNFVPVPVSSWCLMTDAERQEYIALSGKRRDGQPWQGPNLPSLIGLRPGPRPRTASRDDSLSVAHLVREGIRDQEGIAELAARTETRMPFPWQLMELSAVAIQFERVLITCGLEAALFFSRYLNSQRENPYGEIVRFAAQPWYSRNLPADHHLMAGMAMWCLLGSYKIDLWKACPSHRFERLILHLAREGTFDRPLDWLTLWNKWSETFGLSTVEEGLEDTARTWRRAIEMINQVTSGEGLPDSTRDFLLKVVHAYSRKSADMISLFNTSPNKYTDPFEYLEDDSRWVHPLVRYTFPRHSPLRLAKDHPLLAHKDVKILWAFENEYEYGIRTLIVSDESVDSPILSGDDAIELYTLFALVDGMFSPIAFSRVEDTYFAVQAFCRKGGIEPLAIMGPLSTERLESLKAFDSKAASRNTGTHFIWLDQLIRYFRGRKKP
jgi:hypothetical protein